MEIDVRTEVKKSGVRLFVETSFCLDEQYYTTQDKTIMFCESRETFNHFDKRILKFIKGRKFNKKIKKVATKQVKEKLKLLKQDSQTKKMIEEIKDLLKEPFSFKINVKDEDYK